MALRLLQPLGGTGASSASTQCANVVASGSGWEVFERRYISAVASARAAIRAPPKPCSASISARNSTFSRGRS